MILSLLWPKSFLWFKKGPPSPAAIIYATDGYRGNTVIIAAAKFLRRVRRRPTNNRCEHYPFAGFERAARGDKQREMAATVTGRADNNKDVAARIVIFVSLSSDRVVHSGETIAGRARSRRTCRPGESPRRNGSDGGTRCCFRTTDFSHGRTTVLRDFFFSPSD